VSFTSYEIGQQGEALVAQYVVGLGWSIEARNFRGRRGEIDLVARHQSRWIFVEVKTSLGRPPLERLQSRQIQRIRRAAEEFLQFRGVREEVDMRFDVIWIWGNTLQLEHCQDAF